MSNKVIACKGVKVRVLPPMPEEDGFNNENYYWTLLVDQNDGTGNDVVVAWHKTRASARKQAKMLRQALKVSA